jgi:hypothetical protein
VQTRFERGLTNLEAFRLRMFASETASLRRSAMLAVRDWFALANMEKELTPAKQNERFPEAAAPYARLLHDWLKTQVLVRDGGLTPDDRTLLEIVEHKLAL